MLLLIALIIIGTPYLLASVEGAATLARTPAVLVRQLLAGVDVGGRGAGHGHRALRVAGPAVRRALPWQCAPMLLMLVVPLSLFTGNGGGFARRRGLDSTVAVMSLPAHRGQGLGGRSPVIMIVSVGVETAVFMRGAIMEGVTTHMTVVVFTMEGG